MSSDMNLFDLLEDSFLKGDVKDELFVDHNYGDIITVSLESLGFPGNSIFQGSNTPVLC